jgi:hypothetical protein
LLFLGLVITLAIVKNNNSGKEVEETAEQKKPDNGGTGIVAENSIPARIETGSTPVDENKTLTPATEKQVADKPTEKSTEKKTEKAKEQPNEEKTTGKLGFKPDEEEPEKPAAKKDVTVSSRVEIQLYLQNDLSNSPERQDIPVTFSLSSPVVYQGVTIINKGATAKGVIKLGKIQTDVDIISITAANGEQIRLKAERGHGKRKEITTNRSYSAFILPGTRINF